MSVGAFLGGREEGDWEAACLACFFWGGGGEGVGKVPVSHTKN